MRNGVRGGPDPLDLATIFDTVARIQRGRGRPLPEMRARNGGERVPLVRNAAAAAGTTPVQRQPAPVAPTSWTGRVLVAGPHVTDPELVGAVVAILAHTRTAGALGVRMDRPTSRSALDVLDDERTGVVAAATVFDGGPVRDVVILLVVPREGARPPGFRPVRDGAGTMPPELDPGPDTLTAACMFAGYLGWRPGQLEAELAAGQLVPSGQNLRDWCLAHSAQPEGNR